MLKTHSRDPRIHQPYQSGTLGLAFYPFLSAHEHRAGFYYPPGSQLARLTNTALASTTHPALNWPGHSGLRTPAMVPTPRGTYSSSSGGRNKPLLEIIPDTRFIVFHGSEHEAQGVKLTGVVRFTAPEAMSILKPKVRLEGKRKISWWFMGGVSTGEVVDKRVFWNQEQKLGMESSHKVKAGPIEWPFEFELAPLMPESVEGLRETYIVYHLHASVARPGWNSKDVVAQEHIRIVRTLGADSMEMTRSRVNADIWANKISYSISIPTDAIVFGTSITADVELTPIKKGIRLGKVELRLMQTVVKRIQASELPDVRSDRSKSEESEVAKVDMEFPEQSRLLYEGETSENPSMADEMYRFKATLALPRSLHQCRQDVDSHQINVSHRFKLMVNIHNPEGHVSQLVCRLPVKLFISPNLPVDERNEVCRAVNGASHEELNSTETSVTAPPEYGLHQLDQIFSDIDPAGYMSRVGSAPATPSGLNAQSRRASQENLASLTGLANGNGDLRDNHGSATPSLLQSRLESLRDVEQSPPTRTQGLQLRLLHALHRQLRPDQRTSDEDHADGISQQDYVMSSLSRVPSYGAALRTPGSSVTLLTDVPPSYVEATSRPPSPSPSNNNLNDHVTTPTQARIRYVVEPDTPISATSSEQTLTSALAALRMPTQAPPFPRAHRESVHHDDAEARIRTLRSRS
ncbi:hypothetical protein B0A54_16953 [Friedmanniomyces endolithicus]|uniref:Arrestin C-terminal-like domain-containing protein n=1 Tax=Friedmanniomyces endolithicus TaxID=329885 RepID=A0A4U0U065_9PEZI|nr:hypothetical protein LTS09_017587 [Friedmanniomyces endolithicus]TKA28261.1 hypothetical protein B0A54_16953 [Friedmanniomyces endolithicus]